MADRADLPLRVFKMLDVATCAWDVACEFHMRGIVLADMADEAWQSGVLLVLVAELRIIGLRKIEFYLRRLRLGRLRCRNMRVFRRRLRSARGEIERCGENCAYHGGELKFARPKLHSFPDHRSLTFHQFLVPRQRRDRLKMGFRDRLCAVRQMALDAPERCIRLARIDLKI